MIDRGQKWKAVSGTEWIRDDRGSVDIIHLFNGKYVWHRYTSETSRRNPRRSGVADTLKRAKCNLYWHKKDKEASSASVDVPSAQRKGVPQVQEKLQANKQKPEGLLKVHGPVKQTKMLDVKTLRRLAESYVQQGFEPPTEQRLLSCYIQWCGRLKSINKWQAKNKAKKNAADRLAWQREKADPVVHAIRLARRRVTDHARRADPAVRKARNEYRREWWARTHQPKEKELTQGQKLRMRQEREAGRFKPERRNRNERFVREAYSVSA